MLDRIKSKLHLQSQPSSSEEGAVARPSKQSSEDVPEVHESMSGSKAKIFRYLSQNQNTAISYEDIAQGSGTAKSKVGKLVGELVEGGLIVKVSSRPRHGTVYQIIGGGPNPSKVTQDTAIPDGSEEEDIDYVNITNDLIWSFIRETRTTDVLLFLTWLERKAGRNA